MPDKTYELSRRKALLGLGTIGVAGAAAGMGTSALFSDEETFEENSITAGTTNLQVTKKLVYATNENLMDINFSVGGSATADGDAVTGCQISDWKPGDKIVVCIEVEVENNPMYVALESANVSESGGANPEPEPGADNGEIGANADVRMASDGDNDSTWDGSGSDPFNGTSPLEFDGSLDDFLGAPYLGSGVLYRGRSSPAGHGDANADPTRIGGDASESNVDAEQVVHYIEIEIPDTVGNEIQGDTLSFDLVWNAEQVRNNSVSSSDDVDGSP